MWAPVLLFSIVAHEYAHAEAAYRQGDDTAYMLGRLTFNPLKHIPPLDGSHVFNYVLSPAAGLKYRQLYGMGYMPIIAFLLFVRLVPAARGIYLWPAQELMQGALSLVGRFHVSDGAFPP